MYRFPLLLLAVLLIGCGERGPVDIPEVSKLKSRLPGTHNETADVPGLESIKYTIHIPSGYDGKTPVPLVLALHYGYEGAKPSPYTGGEMIDAFQPGLADLNAIIIAPDALGGSWTKPRNEKAAVWLTESVMKTYAIDKSKVVITGYSLGGEGTWYIGSRHQDLFTGAIPVAAVPAGNTEWKIPVYVIHSNKDEVVSYDAAQRHTNAIKEKGAKLEFKTVSGLSHYNTADYSPYLTEAVTWLQSQWN